MTYQIDGTEYDEDDFDDMTYESIATMRQKAEKWGRDADLLINRGKAEWEAHGRNPMYGLPAERYQELKTRRAEAVGLLEAIKLYLDECETGE